MKVKDSIGSRVGRIISGSAKRIVEVLESATPEIVMEEAISEIDQAILEVREELGKVEAERHLAAKRLEESTRTHDELTSQIELALDKQREDLAEAAVQRQLDIESQLPVLRASIGEAQEKAQQLESYIAALQAKKREMRDELRNWRASKEIAEKVAASSDAGGVASVDAKVARAESVFERLASNKPAAQGFDAQNASKLAELEELARHNRIKERLTQLKLKRNGGGDA
jgi:phage shock protein A